MIVDGKEIAGRIYTEVSTAVAHLSRTPTMAAIACDPNFETQKYLELKKRKAAAAGISLRVVELPQTVTTEQVVACIEAVAVHVDGVVVQLPFPAHVDRERILQAVPAEKDPDGFSYSTHTATCIPPVAGAILEIMKTHNVSFADKNVVVLGQGRLVGGPMITYLQIQGIPVKVLTEDSADYQEVLREADIIISGIGKSHFVTKDMVKTGVMIFDAGTSEDGGVVVGDVHPEVAEIATLFTPVPGGIGPITVAVLLRNLVQLARKRTE